MTYRGRKERGVDYFEDIIEGDVQGVLSGLGAADFDSLQEQYSQDGLQIKLNCRSCNKRYELTVEWLEIYIIGLNGPGRPPKIPQGWKYSDNNHSVYLQKVCARCHNPGLAIHITPDEARRHMQSAINAGLVSRPLLAQMQQRFGT